MSTEEKIVTEARERLDKKLYGVLENVTHQINVPLVVYDKSLSDHEIELDPNWFYRRSIDLTIRGTKYRVSLTVEPA